VDWEERKIEQVNEFKYLGYTYNERATDKAHITEIVTKANKVGTCGRMRLGNRREKVKAWFQEENNGV
jgi:hypothetical protein